MTTAQSKILDWSIDTLALPTRVENSLHRWGIETIGRLLRTPKNELFEIPGFGIHSFRYLCEALAGVWFMQWDDFREEINNATRNT